MVDCRSCWPAQPRWQDPPPGDARSVPSIQTTLGHGKHRMSYVYIVYMDVCGAYVYTYITLHYITLHNITSHYIPLYYITFHYITLHSITLHYIHISYIIYKYIDTYKYMSHMSYIYYMRLYDNEGACLSVCKHNNKYIYIYIYYIYK